MVTRSSASMWWCVCGARRIVGKLKLPRQAANAVYFNCVEIELNVVFSFVPRPFTTAMIAIEMPAAWPQTRPARRL